MYVGRSSYFVTLCCAGRRPAFADSCSAIELIETLRKNSVAQSFAVNAYCAMPDHFHMFVAGIEPASDLLAFVKNIKQTTSRVYHRRSGETLWQKKFYDHILRPRDNAEGVAAYIWMNPVRKGLCTDPPEYAYSGSFVVDWKKAIAPVESWVPHWKKRLPA
jgi:putative transposase